MDTADYGIAAMRRGSYDDVAPALVSIDPLPAGKGERDPVADC